ncbi:phosphopyruvate hydratase [Marasmitruncus massiliensis]|uniref:phosphopyruvate hydratase n=1 Tax=Marasmitruncus massiliensis TaxID=1944642 RepID=UPI00241D112C|nr:enolase [Marasmitruncus massiliensis]
MVSVTGREILNARGKPTVEATVITENGIKAIASVPSGTSRGKYEAHELYDGGTRYRGYGTKKAAQNISTVINKAICGMDVTDQQGIDQKMIDLDGTNNKEVLGGNTILAVSVAVCRAAALSQGKELYHYIAPNHSKGLPDVIATVIAGGEFSTSGLEFEDYLLLLNGFDTFAQQVEALADMRYRLEKLLVGKYGMFPEDGGALAPPLKSTAEAFECMLQVARESGYAEHVTLGLDVAASELYNKETGCYKVCGREMDKHELIAYYVSLAKSFPLTYIEDPFDQDDFDSYTELKKKLGDGIQIVGDDLFVTNIERLKTGIENNCANTLLLKMNQIGTVTETVEACALAEENGYDVTVSLRSGETTDDFIADLAAALGTRQIKLGSPVRAERNVKYNRLLKIADDMHA